MSIAATLIVQFGSSADNGDLVVMELDDSRNLDANGEVKSSFAPGDAVYFLLHHAPTLTLGSMVATAGYIVPMGTARFERVVDQQLFVNTEPISVTHLPAGGVGVSWYGRESATTQSTNQLTATDPPAIGVLTYQFDALLYRLQTPGVVLADNETFPVAVVATMEVA
jgi:hypothetical protein